MKHEGWLIGSFQHSIEAVDLPVAIYPLKLLAMCVLYIKLRTEQYCATIAHLSSIHTYVQGIFLCF